MPTLPFADHPEYVAAVNRETQNRELAFLPEPPPLCGIRIRHMNCRHLILLTGCGNKFITGGHVSYIDVAQFVWFLSADYCVTPGARELFIATHVAKADLLKLTEACSAYVSVVWQDAPPGPGNAVEKRYVADVTYLVDRLAREYRWTDEHILEMPLARAFQYLRMIRKRTEQMPILFNPSDKVIGDIIAKRNRSTNVQHG